MLYGRQATVFGWTLHVGSEPNPRTIRNFPMQANGAEMLRLACCLGTENGIRICAPVHDAVLITAPANELAVDVARMRRFMDQASSIVLAGFTLRTEVETVLAPNHYSDPRGVKMRQTIMALL
jgi:DNA polymerase-1